MRLFSKYGVGDKVMINHQGETLVGTIERDKGFVGGKKIAIHEFYPSKKDNIRFIILSYHYYKKNIIGRISD